MSMFPTSEPDTSRSTTFSWRRRIALVLFIAVKLLLITAMLERDISEFVYRGF